MIAPTTQKQPPSGSKKASLFTTAEGKNYAFVFLMVTLLFLLWGVCNGMIDILNKHFQDSLQINKMQSALVQFANYMGYFFMAIPSGILAQRYGYKGAILIGLSLVALGAFWFIPATHIGTYWAFLLGLFILATGLTCLETVANPYATVLGPPETGTVRINFAQSGNGVGWMIGPVLGGMFVLSSTGVANTSNADLYKPYLIVGIVVTLLFLAFLFCDVPDLHNMEETKAEGPAKAVTAVKPLFKRWHFVLAVAAQFFYVAAQTGVFSYFVNYISSDTPVLSQSAAAKLPANMTYPASMLSAGDITDVSAFVAKLQNDSDAKSRPVSEFIWSQFTTNQTFLAAPSFAALAGQINAPYADKVSAADLDKDIVQEKKDILVKGINQVLQTNVFFEEQRFAGVVLPEDVRRLVAQKPAGEQLVRLNRGLLESAYPADQIVRSPNLQDAVYRITDQGAGKLLSFGAFGLFLLGRFTGSFALRLFKAHLMLSLQLFLHVHHVSHHLLAGHPWVGGTN
jgi:fucose permease